MRTRPGRQLVSFLLVSNLAITVANIIQTAAYSKEAVELAGPPWLAPAVASTALPLRIFYR